MPEHGEGSKLEKVLLQSSSLQVTEKVTNSAEICPVGRGWCPSHSLSRRLSQGGLQGPRTSMSVSNLRVHQPLAWPSLVHLSCKTPASSLELLPLPVLPPASVSVEALLLLLFIYL